MWILRPLQGKVEELIKRAHRPHKARFRMGKKMLYSIVVQLENSGKQMELLIILEPTFNFPRKKPKDYLCNIVFMSNIFSWLLNNSTKRSSVNFLQISKSGACH